MAAKLILSWNGSVIREYPLNKERMTIGRKSYNDIVIDNLAVSGEHAVIVTIMHDSFLEDTDSTNGLEVNGVPTKKHFLQNNDVIDIGKHKLKYINDQTTQTTSADFERTMVLRGSASSTPSGEYKADVEKSSTMQNSSFAGENTAKTGKFDALSAATSVKPATVTSVKHTTVEQGSTGKIAALQILTGSTAGRELDLVKNLTTLGKPGFQVAVITRRPQGFYITHVEGGQFPSVNGRALTNQAHQLNDHDVIELAGVKMEFYFKDGRV